MSKGVDYPRALSTQDLAVLTGLVAALEGEMWSAEEAREAMPSWTTGVVRVLLRNNLVSDDRDSAAVRRALASLNTRLREANGESISRESDP